MSGVLGWISGRRTSRRVCAPLARAASAPDGRRSARLLPRLMPCWSYGIGWSLRRSRWWCWRPLAITGGGRFYLLEDCLNVILVNAAHDKGLPGRKTDVSDAAWLCQMGECGLLKASFVPPEPIRQLRDLSRYRATLAAERTREASRLEKELEDAGIKLSSVATDILGVSGRAMLTALIEGERDVHVLAEMAKARMRPKIPQLVEALTGNFGEHHAFLCRLHLERIDQLSAAILELSTRIEDQMSPFARQLEHLTTIPGVGQATAEVIIAETGGDMSRFRTAGHLASSAVR